MYRPVGQKSWYKPNRELVYRYSATMYNMTLFNHPSTANTTRQIHHWTHTQSPQQAQHQHGRWQGKDAKDGQWSPDTRHLVSQSGGGSGCFCDDCPAKVTFMCVFCGNPSLAQLPWRSWGQVVEAVYHRFPTDGASKNIGANHWNAEHLRSRWGSML